MTKIFCSQFCIEHFAVFVLEFPHFEVINFCDKMLKNVKLGQNKSKMARIFDLSGQKLAYFCLLEQLL